MTDKQNNWYAPLLEAIPLRHSVRTFLSEPLPKELPEQIEAFFGSLSVPFPHDTKLQYFKAEPGRKLYNNGVNPVDNFALLSQTDLVSISKTGFVGELVMLYAVSLGLGTCWFGHYKLSEVGRYVPDISSKERIKESTLGYGYGNHVDVGERVVCCMPFGRADESSKRVIDLIMKKKGANRKPIQQLIANPDLAEDLPKEVAEVLTLASLAPSAGNSQMWRFDYDKDAKIVTVTKPVGYKHFKWEHSDVDIGMCAAHIWLGLLSKGYQPNVEVSLDAGRALWSFHLA
jgi:nitroreductase